MSKVDFSVLDNYSETEVKAFDSEIGAFLDGGLTKTTPSKEAVAYFYLTLHKKEQQRRGLSLDENFKIIRGLQGQILTLIEASIVGEQQKALKDIINNYFSNAQSLSQDYDWGRYDERTDKKLGYYIEVQEDHEDDGCHWGICLGNFNPDDEHYFEVESKEKAFEIKEKLNNYVN